MTLLDITDLVTGYDGVAVVPRAGVKQVLSAAQSLSGDSNRLKLEVDKFLSSVRAA